MLRTDEPSNKIPIGNESATVRDARSPALTVFSGTPGTLNPPFDISTDPDVEPITRPQPLPL